MPIFVELWQSWCIINKFIFCNPPELLTLYICLWAFLGYFSAFPQSLLMLYIWSRHNSQAWSWRVSSGFSVIRPHGWPLRGLYFHQHDFQVEDIFDQATYSHFLSGLPSSIWVPRRQVTIPSALTPKNPSLLPVYLQSPRDWWRDGGVLLPLHLFITLQPFAFLFSWEFTCCEIHYLGETKYLQTSVYLVPKYL